VARLFVAVETPAPLAEGLLRIVPAQRGIRPTAVAQLHLTLRFLGEQDDAAAARIEMALREVAAPSSMLQVKGVGRFRSRQGAILWAGLDESAPMLALFDAITAVLERVGIAPEGRRFWPHLTLARCRPDVPEPILRDWLSTHRDLSLPSWTIDRFVLFESFLDRQGARHDARAVYPLVGLSPDC
jgi:2'-5' RNA ligase